VGLCSGEVRAAAMPWKAFVSSVESRLHNSAAADAVPGNRRHCPLVEDTVSERKKVLTLVFL